MASYQEEQLKLIQKIEESFKKGETPSTIVEPVSDYIHDTRTCLTTVFFTPQDIEEKIIQEVINPLKEVDPLQYYYIPGSLHMTIQNIRVINDPPHFDEQTIKTARSVCEKVAKNHKPFDVDVRRLFELPTSLAINVFTGKEFGDLVSELRSELEQNGAADDKKYIEGVTLANITVSRFTDKPNEEFNQKVKQLKEVEIGTFTVDRIILITTNSVSYPSKTKIIEEFLLT